MSFSILDTIGNTPMVEIKNLNPNPGVKILAKVNILIRQVPSRTGLRFS